MKTLRNVIALVILVAGTMSESVAEDRDGRKVPAMSAKVFRQLSEAQRLIDPASLPNAPAGARANPEAALELLYNLLGQRGINSFERAQVWNTLAFAHYTLGDVDQTIGSYEAVLRQGPITGTLELSTLRALFQLHFLQENYAEAIAYTDRWQALSGQQDPAVIYVKANALRQLGEYRAALSEAQMLAGVAASQGIQMREDWLYLQVILFTELGDLDNSERVLRDLMDSFPKEQYRLQLANLTAGDGAVAEAPAHPVFAQVPGGFRLLNDDISGFRDAGIDAGAVILGIKFSKIATWSDVAALDLRPGTPITVEVQRGQGSTFLMVRLTPEDIQRIVTPGPHESVDATVDISQGGFGITDGEYLPIVIVQPVYPRRALSRGLTGWVVVEFAVTEQGTVKDPVVVENCAWVKTPGERRECYDSPNGVFDNAAIQAALKFKYKPKVLDGRPIETRGVQNKVTFELLEE